MANKDTEIEIKIRLSQNEVSYIKQKLSSIAKFVKNSKQSDQYYNSPNRNFLEPKYIYEWLSIRRRTGKASLNYKHFHPEDAEAHTHCDEYDAEINNPEQLEKVFSSLGFKHLVTVEKEREVYVYNDEFEIGLDAVYELGNFIEIETIKDFGSVENARERLFEFAKQLGLDPSKSEKIGYPHLLLVKRGLIG